MLKSSSSPVGSVALAQVDGDLGLGAVDRRLVQHADRDGADRLAAGELLLGDGQRDVDDVIGAELADAAYLLQDADDHERQAADRDLLAEV